MLKFAHAGCNTNPELRHDALDLIREAEANIPLVDEDDRSSIIWEAGLTLVEAGELDWAERIAECESYCPENTEVLLHTAKARAAKGQTDRALDISCKIAALANSGLEFLINRAFDLKDVAEFLASLGRPSEARQHLDSALRVALQCQSAHDIDGEKCVGAISICLAKLGDPNAARDAANQITIPARRDYALQQISELEVKAAKTEPTSS